MSEEFDDFDDRADLATADQTIRRLKAEVERLKGELDDLRTLVERLDPQGD